MTIKRFFLFVIIPIIIVVLGVLTLVQNQGTRKLPLLGQINHFQLTNNREKEISNSDLDGKIWVANFIFTSCSGVCPMMTKNMKKVQKVYHKTKDLQFVSFSVNPETDTPEVLQNYAKKHKADVQNWHFLTGKRDKIKKLMFEDFKLGFAEDIMFHSDRIVLIDRKNKIRGYYTGTERGSFNQLSDDIAVLLNEK